MTSLLDRYRGAVCDLDGVVYRGQVAVPHAVDSLVGARDAGWGIAYATNNASRPPQDVHEHLADLGVRLDVSDVVTSAMAGARHLAEVLDAGARVLAVGGPGVAEALTSVDLVAVRAAEVCDDAPVTAVLQGYGKDVAWNDLAQAAYAVQRGVPWVATNTDLTIPTAGGIAPGNGTLVGAVRAAVDVDPTVVGKPYPPLYLQCAQHLGLAPEQTLAIGDRLDTDIEGAARTGMDSLFVFTGVHGPRDIVVGPASQRPTYLGRDLRCLEQDYAPADSEWQDGVSVGVCGDVHVRVGADGFTLEGAGTSSERLRAVVAAGVRAADEGVDVAGLDWVDVDSWILEVDR